MTYQEALQYFNSFVNYEKKDNYAYDESFKLDRMRQLAAILGNPQNSVPSIHVAGSKGKGSTCAFIHSILKAAGFRTGLYTSPHLVSFRERIRIQDCLISEDDIARLTDEVRTAVCGMGEDRPSFFEVYTALAYLYFSREKVDLAVYETGLGGRLDATNIIKPLVTVITPVSLEHTDKLGHSLREIALEKAGIIKENVACVIAPQEGQALAAIEEVCRAKGSDSILVGSRTHLREIAANDTGGTFDFFGIKSVYKNVNTKLLGRHQMANASVAITAVEALKRHGINISQEAIMDGIASARWDGRLDVLSRNPLIVLDGAQNRASARVLALAVKELFRYNKLILVLGVSKDKDIRGMLEELLPLSDYVVVTKSKVVERAMEPGVIKDLIGKRKGVAAASSIDEALRAARMRAQGDDLILVTGSLFLVGDARTALIEDPAHAME